MTQSHQVKQRLNATENGRIGSDNLKTGLIPNKEQDVKTIEVVLDACLSKKVLRMLKLMCMCYYLT